MVCSGATVTRDANVACPKTEEQPPLRMRRRRKSKDKDQNAPTPDKPADALIQSGIDSVVAKLLEELSAVRAEHQEQQASISTLRSTVA
eukprot:6230508-Prymnesium_polylepis.1